MRQSSGVSAWPRPPASAASAAASVALTGRAPFIPIASTRMYWSASTSPGQTRDLGAVRREQDHRRVAADVEACALPLRARAVAVDVDRDEVPRPLDEVLPIEDRRLDLVARRAPRRAPVQEHRLVRGLGRGERAVDVACMPGDAGVGVPTAAGAACAGGDAGAVAAGGCGAFEHAPSAARRRSARL